MSFGRATTWSYLLTGGPLAMTLVVTLVLARILGPEAFGTIAMATALIMLFQLLTKQGLEAAIIQRPDLTPAHLDTAFWLTVGTICVLMPSTIVASGWWADVNRLPDLQPITIGLAPLIGLKGLGVIHEAQLRRSMNFRALAIRTNTAVLAGGAAGIVLALSGAGVWALVGQQLLTAGIEVVLVWRLSGWRPTVNFEWRCARDLAGFSGASALAGLGVFANTRADALLTGLFFGPVLVGLYRMCTRFTDVLLELTAGALRAVMLPELARFAGRPTAFADRTVAIIRFGSLIAAPGFGVLAAVAGPLMALIGDAWSEAASGLAILCVLGVAQSLSVFITPILQAAGRPALVALLTWGSAVVNALTFVALGLVLTGLSTADQLLWLAGVRTGVFAAVLVVTVPALLRRVVGIPFTRMAAATWPGVAGALAAYTVPLLLHHILGWPAAPPVDVLFSGTAAVISAALVLYVLDPTLRRAVPRVVRKLGRLVTTP